MPGNRKITTKKPIFGQSRSKAFNTTKRKFELNLQSKRIWLPDEQRFIRVRVTAGELRTIDKIGIREFLRRAGVSTKKL
jgi:large subunit ribosomal protein L28